MSEYILILAILGYISFVGSIIINVIKFPDLARLSTSFLNVCGFVCIGLIIVTSIINIVIKSKESKNK